MSSSGTALLAKVKKLDGHETEYIQAVEEVLVSLEPLFKAKPEYLPVMERLLEPERIISFRVPWYDDNGVAQVNRGWRVQFNSAIGPYKGGLRLHPSVNQGIIKFLGFEQIFKNSLTTLPMGGGKGGSNFDPKGKSDREVERFCQAFMLELFRHIGPDTDVPAGDIGVGGREIGYLFGMYKKCTGAVHPGVLTGKGLNYGGSLIRPEATGYGAVYFAAEMLKDQKGKSMDGLHCAISGSGNVAQYALEKCLDLKAVPTTLSDSAGSIYCPTGFTRDMLADVMTLKNEKRGRLSEFGNYGGKVSYHAGKKPWAVAEKVDVALPSATQNEIDKDEAEMLVTKGCFCCVEGANMPSDPPAIEVFHKKGVLFGPAKAANAGGVATSGLEMSQSSMRLSWTREEVDGKLHDIMKKVYSACKEAAKTYSTPENIQAGANIAGFLKVADAMIAQGNL